MEVTTNFDSDRAEYEYMQEQEKQAIEEMAKVIERTEQIARDAHCGLPSPTMYAKDLYWKGYRRQSEGEWVKVAAYNDGVLNTAKCSVCKTFQPVGCWDYYPYCPHCGAHMKGGAE